MRTTIAAGLVTIATLTPAAWRATEAELQADGPALRPAATELHVGDATIRVEVDRGIMRAGQSASAMLVATSDRPHAVKVDVTALEDLGYGAERVPNPPLRVGRRELTLQARPGGGPPAVASFALDSKKAPPGLVSWFDLIVTPHGERAPDHAWDVSDRAASVGVATWTGNAVPIAIEPPARIPGEGSFTFAVRIKNTTKQDLECAYANVGGSINGGGGLEGRFMIGSGADFEVEDITDDGDGGSAIPAGAEKLWLFKLEPAQPDVMKFLVIAQVQLCSGGGAMETATFERPSDPDAPTPAVAAN